MASSLEEQEFMLAYGLRVFHQDMGDKGNWSMRLLDERFGNQEAVNPVRKRPLGEPQR